MQLGAVGGLDQASNGADRFLPDWPGWAARARSADLVGPAGSGQPSQAAACALRRTSQRLLAFAILQLLVFSRLVVFDFAAKSNDFAPFVVRLFDNLVADRRVPFRQCAVN